MAEAGVTVKYTDKGLKQILKNLKELGKLRATVGYQGEDALRREKPNGATVSAVARYNEFGTIHIPARPFMRLAAKASGPSIAKTAANELRGVADASFDPINFMAEVGNVLAGEVLDQLDSTRQWATPNAPSTIAKKGEGLPPLDAGHQSLHKGLSWAVQEGRGLVKKGKPTK